MTWYERMQHGYYHYRTQSGQKSKIHFGRFWGDFLNVHILGSMPRKKVESCVNRKISLSCVDPQNNLKKNQKEI